MATAPPSFLSLIDGVTIGSFLLVALLLFLAYALSVFLLPPRTSTKLRVIFIWHLFDGLIHFVFEGSFLYHSFTARVATGLTGPSSHVLWGDSAVAYGARHSQAPLAKLWQEYAKADFRWGESDICVVALELLTVFVGGPLALWICDMVRREDQRMWFWVTVLATGELYGGECAGVRVCGVRCAGADFGRCVCRIHDVCARVADGKPQPGDGQLYVQVRTSTQISLSLSLSLHLHPLYPSISLIPPLTPPPRWVHLFFFNTIWVWIPLWLLYEAYNMFLPALQLQAMVSTVSGTASALGGATFGADSSDEEDNEGEGEGEGKKGR